MTENDLKVIVKAKELAVHSFKLECIMANEPYFVDNDDRETLGETFWRLWDWSEKRILDKDKYVLIKTHIGRR